MRGLALAVICSGIAAGQITNVKVAGTTSTQAVISYLAPAAGSCRIEISKQPAFTPLVPDVDPALFPGEDQDSRTGSITAGRNRTFVAGRTQVERAASGAKYSRALQADTDHFFRITCGPDMATGKFRTANIPLGATHMDALQADAANPGSYLWPSNNVLLFPELVDPKTGILAKNVDTSGWAYAGASPASGVTFAAAQDPSGRWANPSYALTSDTNWASYTGNSQDWLWLRLGYYPDSSTFTNNELSFQNIVLEGLCAGEDCGTGGELADICITRLGIDNGVPQCEDPNRTIALTKVLAPVTVCGDGAPCTTPAKPGDVMTFDRFSKNDTRASDGYVYNTAANYKSLFFTNVNDCRRLFAGETITMWLSNLSASLSPTIVSLDCEATPPQATLNNSATVDANGTVGIPFYYNTGPQGNPRYGILLRKHSTTANSTIYINSAKWIGASSVSASFGPGSGGFNRVCTKKADANGFYHCHAGFNMITGIRTEADGSLTVRFLGIAYVFGQVVPGLKSGFQFYGNALSDFLWDDEDPNTFYGGVPSGYSSGGTLVIKARYTGNDVACGEAGSLCPAPSVFGNEFARLPQLPATIQVLNACLRTCSSPADDMSLEAQLTRYTSTKNVPYVRSSFPNCAVESVQGKTIVGACRQFQQDSFAWLFAFDIGNGLPAGSGYEGRFGNADQVFAANPLFARAASRWCTLHTYQNIRAEGIATPEYQNEKVSPFTLNQVGTLAACNKTTGGAGNCAPCPNVTVNGVNYAGKNICDSFTSSTAWNISWGSAPDEWRLGEPVSVLSNLHWLQTLAVGDVIQHGGEQMRILQKNGPSQYIVERGVGPDQSYQFPRPHSAGAAWITWCENEGGHWFYERDSDAMSSTTYFPTEFVNHAMGRDGVRLHPDYGVSLAPFTPSAMKDTSYNSALRVPEMFAGKPSMANGNSIEKHPSYAQEDAPAYDQQWFIDGHPYLFTGNAGSNTYGAVKISGNLYRYRYSGTIDAKYYDVAAFTGTSPLREISGPSSAITGGAADAYKLCRALMANECVAGSAAGDIYVNVPALDLTQNWCKEGEFYLGWRHICVANFDAIGASYAQWALPASGGVTVKNFAGGRVLTRLYEPYSGSSTTNAKATPDGRWVALRSNLMLKLPPFPQKDSVSRSSFIPVTVDLRPPAGTTVNNAVVEFGYTPNLYCTARTEVCVAAKAAIDESNPFLWPTEAGGDVGVTGVPCSTGCRITIPGISGKVLYYRWKYRDAARAVQATSGLQVVAVR